MKNILNIQKDGVNTLSEKILNHSNSKLKKIYVVVSDVRETGYDIIEECLIDLKARKFIAFGIDKKNTTRKILESVLKFTKNVYVWDNNGEIEMTSNVYIFEYETEAYVYLANGSITDSMFKTDLSFYTELVYDLTKDKKEYDEYVTTLTQEVKESFAKLTKEYIEELAENKCIFTTKQYIHSLPSIAEFLGKNDSAKIKEEQIKPIPKIEINVEDIQDVEIDLGDIAVPTEETYVEEKKEIISEVETEAFGLDEVVEEISDESEYEISDEAIDMEAIVLSGDVVKIDKKDIEKKTSKEAKQDKKQASKKINLTKVSNVIMELAKKPTKGRDVNKVKIPNYIKDIIPQFFEIMDEATLVSAQDGEYKQIKIKLEIIDVNTNNKYTDLDAMLKQKVGQTYIEFESDKLEQVLYEEMDIARIIKLAKDSYHIEIIPQGIEEYNLWDKLCTNNFKGSSRQYGLM